MNWKKGMMAAMLVVGSMVTLTGCGGNEREQALAPYVGTWIYEKDVKTPIRIVHSKSVFEITKDENNPNTLTAKYQMNDKTPRLYVVSYDEKDKTVKLGGNQQILIQKDDKGEYITGTSGTDFHQSKFYKQK